MRVLELYCGIGGAAVALGRQGQIVAAVDLSRPALAVYQHNFPRHRTLARNLETLGSRDLRRWRADLWWLSPPCQPFTRRGRGRDVDDPRCQSLLHLIGLIERELPPAIGLENVTPFAESRACQRLLAALERAGYEVFQTTLCPSRLGVPNRRPRFYLVAARGQDLNPPRLIPTPSVLADHLQSNGDSAELAVAESLLRDYSGALDIVDQEDPSAITACFTAAYGRSPVRSGSYLRRRERVRRFSPREILSLLGFPPDYVLPEELAIRKAWKLVGNSLSIAPVRAILGGLEGLDLDAPSRPHRLADHRHGD
ncbi:MAG: DNA cytosine methyltransferase [Acidobacteriota bacterium]